MRLFPQHTGFIKEVLHREPNENDFKDVTTLFKNIKSKKLKKCGFIKEYKSGCYLIEIPYLGTSVKYALFTDSVGVWASDMPIDRLRTLLASTGFDVEPCNAKMSVLGVNKLNKQAAYVVAALLFKLPYTLKVSFTGVETDLSYEDGVLESVTPAYQFSCNLLNDESCNLDLKQLAIFLRDVVPISYSLYGTGDAAFMESLKAKDPAYSDYTLGINFCISRNAISAYKVDSFILSTDASVFREQSVKQANGDIYTMVSKMLERQVSYDDMHNVSHIMVHTDIHELCKSRMDIEEFGNLYRVSITYNGVSCRHAIVRDGVDTWWSTMSVNMLSCWLSDLVDTVEPPMVQLGVYSDKMSVEEADGLVTLALLEHYPDTITFRTTTNVLCKLHCEDGVLRYECDGFKYKTNLLSGDTCRLDLAHIAAIMPLLPIQYDIQKYANKDDVESIKSDMTVIHSSVSGKVVVGTINDKSVVVCDGVILREKGLIMSGSGECEELLDTYMALKKDGEFSKHVVEMLSELEVPIASAEKWLRSKIKEMS